MIGISDSMAEWAVIELDRYARDGWKEDGLEHPMHALVAASILLAHELAALRHELAEITAALRSINERA